MNTGQDMSVDINSKEAALWSETMRLKSENEWLHTEIKRLRAERDKYKGTLRFLAGEGVTAARRALEDIA